MASLFVPTVITGSVRIVSAGPPGGPALTTTLVPTRSVLLPGLIKPGTTRGEGLAGDDADEDEDGWREDPALATLIPSGFQLIRSDQIPADPRQPWVFPPLYSEVKERGGKRNISMVAFIPAESAMVMRSGQEGTANPKITKRQVVAKSTRDLMTQALQEMRSYYKKRIDAGMATWGREGAFQLMSGHPYVFGGSVTVWPIFVQAKIDGVRMMVWIDAQGVLRYRSRGNRQYTHFQHLDQEILLLLKHLPANTPLDGEIYSHGMDFSAISGLIGERNQHSPELLKLKYMVFDVIREDLSYQKRYEMLCDAYHRLITERKGEDLVGVHVLTSTLAYNDDEVQDIYDLTLNEGYEGVMIKIPGMPYQRGRKHAMFKLKDFVDYEVTIVDVEESKGSEAGLAMLVCRDPAGSVFRCRMRGSFERRRMWFQNPRMVIGKMLTVRQQKTARSGYVAPRCPVGVAIRDYEGSV